MTNLSRRLAVLEDKQRPAHLTVRRVVCATPAEAAAARASVKPGEFLILRTLVTPPHEGAACV